MCQNKFRLRSIFWTTCELYLEYALSKSINIVYVLFAVIYLFVLYIIKILIYLIQISNSLQKLFGFLHYY